MLVNKFTLLSNVFLTCCNFPFMTIFWHPPSLYFSKVYSSDSPWVKVCFSISFRIFLIMAFFSQNIILKYAVLCLLLFLGLSRNFIDLHFLFTYLKILFIFNLLVALEKSDITLITVQLYFFSLATSWIWYFYCI